MEINKFDFAVRMVAHQSGLPVGFVAAKAADIPQFEILEGLPVAIETWLKFQPWYYRAWLKLRKCL